MTIHQDPIIAMQLVPFRVNAPIPDAIQDDLREAMLFDAKRMPKLNCDRDSAGVNPASCEKMAAAKRAKGDETFRRLWPTIRHLKQGGWSNEAVAREVGMSAKTIQRIWQRGRQNPTTAQGESA